MSALSDYQKDALVKLSNLLLISSKLEKTELFPFKYPSYRHRPFEKQYYPKPVLSQTGSPILPSLPSTPRSYTRKSSLQIAKPISILESVHPILPYQEKEFNDQLHDSLQRAVNRPRYHGNSYAVYDANWKPGYNPKPLPVSNHPVPSELKIIYSKHGAVDYRPVPATPSPLQVVNKQYNTPIGLYSASSLHQELEKQVG